MNSEIAAPQNCQRPLPDIDGRVDQPVHDRRGVRVVGDHIAVVTEADRGVGELRWRKEMLEVDRCTENVCDTRHFMPHLR